MNERNLQCPQCEFKSHSPWGIEVHQNRAHGPSKQNKNGSIEDGITRVLSGASDMPIDSIAKQLKALGFGKKRKTMDSFKTTINTVLAKMPNVRKVSRGQYSLTSPIIPSGPETEIIGEPITVEGSMSNLEVALALSRAECSHLRKELQHQQEIAIGLHRVLSLSLTKNPD